MEPVFEKVNCLVNTNVYTSEIKAECRTDIFSGSVSKILSIKACVYPEEEVKEELKVRYGGKIIFRICYLDDEFNLKKCECGNEFFGSIQLPNPNGNVVNAEYFAEMVNADLTGSKLVLTSLVVAKITIKEYNEVQVLCEGKDFICEKTKTPIINGFNVKKGIYPIEEEIELGYMVKEVLTHNATACVTACQCGVGCVIVDGEVYLTALLLQNNENSGIIREDRVAPFRIEVEYEEAMPQMLATAKVNVKGFKTEISVDEEKGVSIVNANVTLNIRSQVFAEEQISLCLDAFSINEELLLNYNESTFVKPLPVNSVKERISERISVSEIATDKKVPCSCDEKIEIVSSSIENEQLKITGVISGKVILTNTENKIETISIEAPFERVLECTLTNATNHIVTALPTNFMVKVLSAVEVEVCSDVIFTIYAEETSKIKCIGEVKSLGEKQVNESAISVYISTEGESLWSLAKRLNVCPDSLLETNVDLDFPLSGKERIVVYRQK